MEVSDIVNMLDTKYSGKGAIPCPNEGMPVKMQSGIISDHGSMGVHASGAYLICGVCGNQHPIARP